MKITQTDSYTVLTDEYDDVLNFASYLSHIIPKKYKEHHLVIDLLKYEALALDELIAFIHISNDQRSNNKSFVFVNTGIDYDVIPEEMIVVPTVQEAEDIIQMEEIERDLGF